MRIEMREQIKSEQNSGQAFNYVWKWFLKMLLKISPVKDI